VYTYLAAIVNVLTALSFLTITPLLNSCETKCNALVISGSVCASCLLLFILCFNNNALYFACVLVCICRVSQAIANVTFESLLDDVTKTAAVVDHVRVEGGHPGLTATAPSSPVDDESGRRESRGPIIPPHIVRSDKDNNHHLNNDINNDINNDSNDPNLNCNLSPSPTHSHSHDHADLSHLISTRASITGYSGMVSYVIAIAPVVAGVYFTQARDARLNLWVQGIILNFLAGIWYLSSQLVVARNLSKALLAAAPRSASTKAAAAVSAAQIDTKVSIGGSGSTGTGTGSHSNHTSLAALCAGCATVASTLLAGARDGLHAQLQTCRRLPQFFDLSCFIVAQIFMSAGASTALTVATIIATTNLQASVFYLAGATFVGIIAAILGLVVYRFLVERRFISPKYVLIVTAVVNCGGVVYVLYSKTYVDLFVIAAICGSQVGGW
jgi:Na+/melibiose symporter-like transporter